MKVLLLFMMAAICAIAHAEGLTKVWEIDLNEPKQSPLHIATVSFRPDGKEILVVAQKHPDKPQFIVLLRTVDPKQNRRYDIDPQTPGQGMDEAVSWAPNGNYAAVGNAIVEVDQGTYCTTSSWGVFAAPDRVIKRFRESDGSFQAVDSKCRQGTPLMISNAVSLMSWSAETGVAIFRRWLSDANPPALVDTLTGRVLHELPFAREMVLADHGRIMCSSLGPDFTQRLGCRSVASGDTVWSRDGFPWIDFRGVLNSRRLVVSRYGRIVDFIDWRWAVGKIKRREVWDLSSGKLVASWKPPYPSVNFDVHSTAAAFPFAISADGDYIAEGGDGKVTLYKIAPATH